ncbi:MAG: DALR anticodon-binding domain-containing protein, partial [Nanoarchaeota archaeon]
EYDVYDQEEHQLIKHLGQFPQALEEAMLHYKPSIVTRYLLDLAQRTNTYYVTHPILKATEPTRSARLMLVRAVQTVLQQGLLLLNMKPLEEM